MSKKTEDQSTTRIIGKFGGIRPLATRLGLAASTVQGWKQRGIIPEKRLKEIIEAAEKDNIDIYSVFKEEELEKKAPIKKMQTQRSIGQQTIISKESERRDFYDRREGIDRRKGLNLKYNKKERRNGVSRRAGIDRRIITEKRRKKAILLEKWAFVERIALSLSVLYMIGTIAFIFMMGPEYHAAVMKAKQIDALETKLKSMGMQLSDLEKKQKGTSIAGSLNRRIEALDIKTSEIARKFKAAGTLGNMAVQGQVQKRIEKLENNITSLSGLLGTIDILNRSGKQEDATSVQELQETIMGLKGDVSRLDGEVSTARNENAAVAQILQDVSKQDLGAAAMLLALGQFREGVNSEKPFIDDLGLIRDLIGNNPELQASVTRLAPYAKTGVLSTARLQGEFGNMAADIIEAGLTGDDISINEQLTKHIGNLVTITKDGKPVLSSDNQITDVVIQAEAQVKKGDIAGAVKTLKTLEGPAAAQAKKWITLAKGTLIANQTNNMLSKNMLSRVSSGRKLSINSLETFLNRNFIQPLGLPKPDELDLKWNPITNNNIKHLQYK